MVYVVYCMPCNRSLFNQGFDVILTLVLVGASVQISIYEKRFAVNCVCVINVANKLSRNDYCVVLLNFHSKWYAVANAA